MIDQVDQVIDRVEYQIEQSKYTISALSFLLCTDTDNYKDLREEWEHNLEEEILKCAILINLLRVLKPERSHRVE